MFRIMELEKHNSNLSSLNNHNIGNQEIYAQDDQSFETDQENLNNSTSSDHFYQTPSAKFIYEQTNITTKKQPSQNVRQTLFQNLDPLNESNNQNLNQHQHSTSFNVFNNSLDSSACTEKTIIGKQPESHNQTFLSNRSISNENNAAFLNNDLMDLTNPPANPVDGPQQSNSQQYEDTLKEKDQTNEKLINYIDQLNTLNKNLSDAILAVQDKFEASLNEKNAVILDLNLQNSVLAKEKKLAVEDVQGLENSFSELHRRYEKLKLALESCKKKEEMFQEECLAFSERLEESQRLNSEYKQRLEILESERDSIVETVKKQSEKEVTMLKAQLKKVEMRFNGLTSQLEQKTQENFELNKMIDELTK